MNRCDLFSELPLRSCISTGTRPSRPFHDPREHTEESTKEVEVLRASPPQRKKSQYLDHAPAGTYIGPQPVKRRRGIVCTRLSVEQEDFCDLLPRGVARFFRVTSIAMRERIMKVFASWVIQPFLANLQGNYNPFDVIANANDALSSISGASNGITGLVGSLEAVIKQLESVFKPSAYHTLLIKFFKVLVNAFLAGTNIVKSLVFNVVMEFGADIVSAICKCFAKDCLQGAEEITAYISSFIESHGGLCATSLGALIAVLLQCVLGLPKIGSMDSALKFFGDRCRNLKNIMDFGKVATPMFSTIGEYLVQSLGFSTKPELDAYLSGYQEWATEVMGLVAIPEAPFAVRVERNPRLVYKVDKLYRQGVNYASLLGDKRLPHSVTEHFHRVFKICEECRKTCDFTGVFGNRPRTKPVVVHLFGESGVGKSGMTWPLACDLNAALSSDVESARNFAENIYFRNTEQEFWDGYSGQNVVCYDDFGQRTDTSASPNEEFMELIRAANLAPYPLHMAELSEKKRTKFSSKAIILTSNVLEQKVNSLTFPDAYRRRVDLCAKVTIQDEFSKECVSLTSQQTVKRLDRNKCDGPVDTRPYVLELYDPESQQPITDDRGPVVLSYEEFLGRVLQAAKVAYEDSEKFNTCLEERISDDRFERLRGMLQIYGSWNGTIHANLDDLKDIGTKKTVSVAMMRGLHKLSEAIPATISTGAQHLWKMVSDMVTLKGLLLIAGTLLVGFGVFKYFRGSSSKGGSLKHSSTHESTTSGDPVSVMPRTTIVEANVSGDPVTVNRRGVTTEANVSGDPTTQKPKIITEATCSGDNSTRKPISVTENRTEPTRCVSENCDNRTCSPCGHCLRHCTCNHCEANVSGDVVTKKLATATTEASVSGDSRTMSRVRTVVESNDPADELQAWRDANAMDLISTRVLSNLYKISRKDVDGTVHPLLNGLFVRDTVMLAPKHLLASLRPGSEIMLESITGSVFVLPVSALQYVELEASGGFQKDACLLRFPRYVNAHTDLVKHFQTMPELSLRRMNVCLPTLRKYSDKRTLVILGNQKATVGVVTLDLPTGPVTIRDMLTYDLPTIGGDCGAPVICQETSVLRKICGIHIAASYDGTRAFGQSVTRGDLEKGLKSFENLIVTDLDILPHLGLVDSQLQFDKEYDTTEIVEQLGLAAETFSAAGVCGNAPFAPDQSDIRKSIIHGIVKEATTKPAHLRYPGVNLMHLNLGKCGVNTPYIPKPEIDQAVNEVASKLLSKRDKRLARVLTFEEAVTGTDESMFIAPLNRSSSPGYPWVLTRPTGTKGKQHWLGSDEYRFDPELKAACERRVALAREGRRAATVWTDTLKDERRPIAKVDALKTRVFANGPMDYTITFRQYFLGFMAHVMENRIENEQSIGTNPFGFDWTRTARKLSSRGRKVFAGDFSTFDGTLNSCIMSAFVGVINKFYDDGPENARIREVLFLDVFNSVHLCQGKYYSMSHSQPSGNPITTVLNSFYNSVSMRISYYRCAKKAGISGAEFERDCSMVSYGDDNVVNFSDGVADWFNQLTVTDAFASFGMIYTDEGKTGEIVAYRTLDQVAYLKRGFRDDGHYWRAPLDLDTILETSNWIRKSPDEDDSCRLNLEASVYELAQHPRDVFDKWTARLVDSYYIMTEDYPRVFTYDRYLEDWNSQM